MDAPESLLLEVKSKGREGRFSIAGFFKEQQTLYLPLLSTMCPTLILSLKLHNKTISIAPFVKTEAQGGEEAGPGQCGLE